MKPASRLIALMTLAMIHAASRQASPDTYKLLGHEAKATGCQEGARCLTTDITGRIDPMGAYVAQCTGRFADYIDRVPADFTGRRFRLSQDYPQQAFKPSGGFPWDAVDFKTENGSVEYLLKVRDYVYEGMSAADWRPENNSVRKWYHVPWMHVGRNPREFLRGLTKERSLVGPELGIKRDIDVQNWAVGFYNDIGGVSIGKTWRAAAPDPSQAQSGAGTVVAKLLFSAALPTDFQADDILAGAPEWEANIFDKVNQPKKIIRTVRLLQMDIAVREPRAEQTGWVFGTFAYDKTASAPTPWGRMIPVGLMWGNDPFLTPSAAHGGSRPKETVVNQAAPLYARNHLGLAGRLNGPVDNRISACMSCHSVTQTPVFAPMFPPSGCSETQALRWFRNLSGAQMFGGVNSDTCVPFVPTGTVTALDYSMQQSFAIQNFRSGDFHNPCAPEPSPPRQALKGTKRTYREYPVER